MTLDYFRIPAHYAAVMMALANTMVLVAIGNPRHPALRQWRWLWVYLALSVGFNLLPMVLFRSSLNAGLLTATIGRILYMPPLLLGLAGIVGHERYRRYAYAGAAILTLQLVIALAIGRGRPAQIPILSTTLSSVLIVAVAAPAVMARLPRVRGSVLRDAPMVAVSAALLGYGSQLAFAPITAGMPEGSTERDILTWVRNGIWVLAYILWWHAFREARRQARPTD